MVAFLRRAVAFFALDGMTVHQLLTDNGSGYRSLGYRSPAGRSGIRHLRARPYHPQTNVERFIRTLLGGWACGAIYSDSGERTAALDDGFGTTTITANTRPSATSPRSLDYSSEPTCSVLTARPS